MQCVAAFKLICICILMMQNLFKSFVQLYRNGCHSIRSGLNNLSTDVFIYIPVRKQSINRQGFLFQTLIFVYWLYAQI